MKTKKHILTEKQAARLNLPQLAGVEVEVELYSETAIKKLPERIGMAKRVYILLSEGLDITE